ncbi:MAG: hypothetical protein M3R21_02990 [Candidatus Dormibacteraeota bacterium]|nr:hypothetical protein [Candidatus Dormibacteraeota bacterium]
MRKINEVATGELVWLQPARLKQAFELNAGTEIVGSLRFERSSLAGGETANQRWTFKREGFWHPRITVRVPGSDVNVALFNPGWAGGGTLDLDGRQMRFVAANFWHSQWDWVDAQNKQLVHFKSHQGLLKTEGQVEVETEATTSPDLPLLVVLGWYLLVLFARDAAASLEAVIASSG